jgi:hypothetical protein
MFYSIVGQDLLFCGTSWLCFLKSGCLLIIHMCCGFDAPILLPPSLYMHVLLTMD